MLSDFNAFLNFTLLEFQNFSISTHHIILLILIAAFTKGVLYLINKGISKTSRLEEGSKYSLYQLIKYTIISIAVVMAFGTLGLNTSAILAGSAALLVGIGFGLQHLFNDFISGIVILFDGTIKVNDVIEVDKTVSKVLKINLRTTTVITRDDKFIVLPNSVIAGGNVINWTHFHHVSRFEVGIRADINADPHRVMPLLKEAAVMHAKVHKGPAPFVRLSKFGDSAIEYTILFWSADVFRVENTLSEIRINAYDLLKKHHIQIPYPQQVVHLVKDAEKKHFD